MTVTQQIITVIMCIAATVLTRFLPFILFGEGQKTPEYVRYLGDVLPAAVFGMLVIYCLKNVNIFSATHAVPEMIGITVTVLLHLWKKNTLLSVAGGTVIYMLIIQWI